MQQEFSGSYLVTVGYVGSKGNHLFRQYQSNPALPGTGLILTDDLGYGDLGDYGQKQIKTPNLDRMAAEGVRFTHFYAGATSPMPARKSSPRSAAR